MANHSLPTLTSTYTNFVTEVGSRIDDAIKQGRSDTVTLTNPPVGSIRWNATSFRWEQNTGTVGTPVWSVLAATYGISISGDAATVDGKSFGTFTAAGGIVYATSTTAASATAAGTAGQALLSGAAGAPTWGTLSATNGGTGQTSYAVGDLLYAPTTTTVGKLADVATGNVLLSGGVGVAPSYGKVGLTTHITGTLGTANGGTNLTSFTSGGAVYATSTSALTTGTLPVASGGTGATTAAAALVALGERTAATGALITPVGTTAQRPTAAAGHFRFNSSLSQFEGYNGTAWGKVGGGATGGGTDDVFIENGQTVTTNYTLTTNKNAVSAGPITINVGITVTVPSGSNWAVV